MTDQMTAMIVEKNKTDKDQDTDKYTKRETDT